MPEPKNYGLFYAIGAYTFWGIVPIFWKQLAHIDSFEIVVHRLVWSCVLVFCLILISRQWQGFTPLLRQKKILLRLFLSSLLISINFIVFIWAVNAGHLIEVSMGYFINPLIQVLFGMLFFQERLKKFEWLSIVFAAAGVVYLVISKGQIPLISLSLAFSFAFYGVIKKTITIPASHGMAIETGFLLIPGIAYLLYIDVQGSGQFGTDLSTDVYFILAGLFTLIPLMLFSAAAKTISMTTLGMTQYIGPSLHLVMAVFLYNEPFSTVQAVSFMLIWSGLLVFTIGQVNRARLRRRQRRLR